MPKLPEQKARDFELLDKTDFKRGELSQAKPVIIKKHLRLPLKPIIGMVVVIVLLGGVYTITKTYFPDLLKAKAPPQAEVKAFEYPLEVNDIKYPSEFLKQKFLENFQKAAGEKDENARYKYIEDNYSLLRVFYAQSASYDFRVQLDKFRDYVKKNYLKKYEANKKLYDYDCIDKLCGEIKMPAEIEDIKKDLLANTAVNGLVRDTILRNFDAAALTSDKNSQGTTYVNVLYSLTAEYNRTHDQEIKKDYDKLLDFLAQNYPEIKVLEKGKIK